MEKCEKSILQLPSLFSHSEFGHYVTSPLYLAVLFAVWVYSSWRNAWFNSASAPCVWTVFFVKLDSYPEVDSRPALLGPQFRFWSLELLHFEIWTLFPRASRIWQPVAHSFSFASEEFFLCQTQEGWRGRRES